MPAEWLGHSAPTAPGRVAVISTRNPYNHNQKEKLRQLAQFMTIQLTEPFPAPTTLHCDATFTVWQGKRSPPTPAIRKPH